MAIKIACPHCDRNYNLADTMAGKTIRCKDCEQTFKVKESNERLMSETDARRKRSSFGASRSSRYDEDDYEDDRPLKKRKKGAAVPVGLLIGGGAGLLVLIVGVILLVVFLSGGNKLTSENIAKVKVGMSEQEVIALVGPPKETKSAGPLGKSMSWSNDKDLGLAVVFDNDGKANMVMPLDASKLLAGGNPFGANNPPLGGNPFGGNNPLDGNPLGQPNPPNSGKPDPVIPNPDPGPNNPFGQKDPRLKPENVHKVRKGMTEQEIVALLGSPFNTHNHPDKKFLIYMGNPAEDGINIQIGVVNGKADSIFGLIGSSTDFPNFNPGSKPGPGPGPVVGLKPTGIDPTRLQVNMTEQQITAQYGQPTKSLDVDAQAAKGRVAPQDLQRPDGSSKPVKVLYYPKATPPGEVELLFVDGLLYSYQAGKAADPMNPPANPNTQGMLANAAKVQKGMSEREVTGLLGKHVGSQQKTVRQGGVTTVIKTWVFNEGAGKPTVTVIFLNGKVDNVLK
jgi:hypothetical protein